MSRGTRGLGYVFPRGRVWWIQLSKGGRKIRETSGSERRGDAVRLLKRRIEEISAGRYQGPDADRFTFEQLQQLLLDDYKANERRSLKTVTRSIVHLRDVFGQDRAIDISADRIVRYLNARRDAGAAPATVQKELAVLKRMFTLAVRQSRVSRRPAFPTVHLNNARAGFFEPGDFAAVLAQLPAPLRPVMQFAYLTGWRRSEILGLTWSRVDFDAGVVRLDVGTTKNEAGRTFPISALPELRELLVRQRQATTQVERQAGQIVPWVFHRSGRQIKWYDAAWRSACKRVGLEGKLVHDFRRTAVRNLERAGVSRSVAMKLTGHKTEAIYRRYAIVAEQDLRDGVAKLAALHATRVLPFQAAAGA